MGTFDLGTLVNLTLNPNQNFFIFSSTPRCEPNKTFFLFNSTRSAGERPRDTDKEQFLQNSCLACQLNCFSTKDRGTLSHQLLEMYVILWHEKWCTDINLIQPVAFYTPNGIMCVRDIMNYRPTLLNRKKYLPRFSKSGICHAQNPPNNIVRRTASV